MDIIDGASQDFESQANENNEELNQQKVGGTPVGITSEGRSYEDAVASRRYSDFREACGSGSSQRHPVKC